MPRFQDLTGHKFDRLTVLSRDPSQITTYWLCQCDCGGLKTVRAGNLKSGEVRSCGCLQRNAAAAEDMTGQVFGRLTVLGRQASKNNTARWLCRCECGAEKVVIGANLRNGNSQSCGCLRVDKARLNKKHGMAGTLEYKRWENIKQRCLNPNNPAWKNYGGRGIAMCPEWASSFEQFLADTGMRPGPGFSLDRIDNNGHYEPGNVRWTTHSQQMLNRRPIVRATKSALEAAEARIAELEAALAVATNS